MILTNQTTRISEERAKHEPADASIGRYKPFSSS